MITIIHHILIGNTAYIIYAYILSLLQNNNLFIHFFKLCIMEIVYICHLYLIFFNSFKCYWYSVLASILQSFIHLFCMCIMVYLPQNQQSGC